MASGGFYGQDVLTGAASRLGQSSFYSDDAPLRQSSSDLDDMVQRNIAEVVAAADASGAEDEPAPPTAPSAFTSSRPGRAPVAVAGRAGPATPTTAARASTTSTGTGYSHDFDDVVNAASTSGDALGAGSRPRPGGAAAAKAPGGGSSSTALLDVPGQPEASLRLHKARIKALEDEVAKASKALTDRDRQLADALKEAKQLKAEQAAWSKDKRTLEAQVDKLKRAAADAEAAARGSDQQVRELAKADSKAERDRRAAEAEVRARDVRLQRALEEVERYKALLQEVRSQERDVKGSAQADLNRLVADNRKLERQRAELITAFKKQLKLIEVLKRQKVHLEAARALQFSEEEFMKVLDMGAS